MTTEAGKRPDLIREVQRAARGIDHSLADEPDYERFDAAIAAIEAEAYERGRQDAEAKLTKQAADRYVATLIGFGKPDGIRDALASALDKIPAVVAEARREERAAERTRLAEAVRGLPSACHDHDGFHCDNDWTDGYCAVIDGAAVLALLEPKA